MTVEPSFDFAVGRWPQYRARQFFAAGYTVEEIEKWKLYDFKLSGAGSKRTSGALRRRKRHVRSFRRKEGVSREEAIALSAAQNRINRGNKHLFSGEWYVDEEGKESPFGP